MDKLIELTDDELELVGGGWGYSKTVVVLKDIGNHNGNGNTVDIGNGNGINVLLGF